MACLGAILVVSSIPIALSGESNGALMVDYTALISTLFNNYDSGIRPRVDDTSPTVIYLGMSLLSIQELDEVNQELSFSCYFQMEWVDNKLAWSPASHNNIKHFSYPQKYVWLPDVTIDNSVETLQEFGFDRNYVLISSSGQVYWAPGGVFKTSCSIDVTYYPFDSQSCTIDFTTRINRDDMVDLEFRGKPVSTEEYSESGTWALVSLTATNRPNFGNFSMVAFTLTLRRLTTYYVVTIVIPVLFLSLTATLVFALPADSGEKMGTSITVLLAFAVYLTIVSDQMPKTSLNVSLLSVWLTMLLGLTALGVVLTVWVINLHFRDDAHPPGRRMRRVAAFLQCLMFKRPWKKQVSPAKTDSGSPPIEVLMDVTEAELKSLQQNPSTTTFRKQPLTPAEGKTPDDVPEMTWRSVAFTFDRFFFYFFSFSLVMFTVVFVVVIIEGL